MIAMKFLTYYPTPTVIDPRIESAFENAITHLPSREIPIRQALGLFRVFLDITNQHLRTIELEDSLFNLSRQFYGFLYDPNLCYDGSTRSEKMVRSFQQLVDILCDNLGFKPLPHINISSVAITADIKNCKIKFRRIQLNQTRVSYYTGWIADSNGNGSKFWNLSFFYEQYGAALTKQIWTTVEDYSNKTIHTTAATTSSHLVSLLTTILRLYPTESDFRFAGTHYNINTTVRNIFASQLIDVRQNEQSVKHFYKHWQMRIRLIENIIIGSSIWSEPPLPLWCPKFKTSSTNAGTHRHLDEQGSAFNDKLVTHIPLSYTDDQAIEALLESIETDIEHVTSACRQQTELTITNLTRRKELASSGMVKWVNQNRRCYSVDMSAAENQCATWEHYRYDSPRNSYAKFLGIEGSVVTFVQNNGLLTSYTLYPFLYLLVEQHPSITESWLINFDLFDKNGKASGFRRSGDCWVATSVKLRRGKNKAEQPVILNEISKALFEKIIAITDQARQHLKEKGDSNWRKLLLGSLSGISKPYKIKKLSPFSNRNIGKCPLKATIAKPSKNANAERAEAILNNLSLTTFRASCGVRVYLKTRSVKTMSEALGHTEYLPKLLSHYLPEPILRYFQARWVRLFQNALAYEAMQDSEYLLDALDFGEEELEAFLRNHKLRPLPEHIMTGHINDLIESCNVDENSQSANMIIPITTPVLQVMNCLVDLVEKAKEPQKFTKAAVNWYETSKFVLESIDTHCCCPKVTKAMSDAIANPLPAHKLKEAIYVA